ncbi:MAG: zinc ribbon domain-containing protein [Chloroflexota bacterium]
MRISWSLALVAVLLLSSMMAVQAEQDPLKTVQVELQPDRDLSSVLVLVTAESSTASGEQSQVRVRIPVEPSAVAYVTDQGMFTADYQVEQQGVNYLIAVDSTEAVVRIEYYFDYQRTENRVRFSYEWLGGSATDALDIRFREPDGASGLSLPVGFNEIGILSDGYRYFEAQLGSLSAADTWSADFEYSKDSASLSLVQSESETKNETNLVVSVIVSILAGLVAGGVIGYVIARKRAASSPVRIVCPQCGRRPKAGDTFCRSCGTRIR